ncbi:MAG: alpha/beta hydrolase [Eubacterium sp.]|nr:alpha/beta hydrolase [Eubacterium sp.]
MKNNRKRHPILLAVLIIIIALIVGFGIWSQDYYHADSTALAALQGSDTVKVTEENGDYLFDGPGTDSALIFYPGAKVETSAYAPLMLKIAESGMDCILVDMPLHFALLDFNAADSVMQEYHYKNWYLGGHSLGGASASMNLAAYIKKGDMPYSGMIYFASYPSKDVTDAAIPVLLIYGTNDMDPEAIEEHKSYLPKDTEYAVIQGGNHAQFGNYGLQKGDGTASITAEEQQEKTVEAISAWDGLAS